MQAIIKAAVETKSPVILQVSKGARQYANAYFACVIWLRVLWNMLRNWAALILKLFFTLDHGDTFETMQKLVLTSGFLLSND